MKYLFIIIIEQDSDLSDFVTTLNNLGGIYEITPGTYFLLSDISTSKHLYESITASNFNSANIFISLLPSSTNYWGYAEKDLWDWLKDAYRVYLSTRP